MQCKKRDQILFCQTFYAGSIIFNTSTTIASFPLVLSYCRRLKEISIMMAAVAANKRRKKTSVDVHINDLPSSLFAKISSYLHTPSKTMFATALTAPSSSSYWQRNITLSASSSSIISSYHKDRQNQTLDFGDIERSLAEKLTEYKY